MRWLYSAWQRSCAAWCRHCAAGPVGSWPTTGAWPGPIALLAAAGSEIVVRLFARAGIFTGPWQLIGAGIAIAILFVVIGMIVLPRLQRTAMAHIAEQSPA